MDEHVLVLRKLTHLTSVMTCSEPGQPSSRLTSCFWNNVQNFPETFLNVKDNLPRRVETVKAAKCGPTLYWTLWIKNNISLKFICVWRHTRKYFWQYVAHTGSHWASKAPPVCTQPTMLICFNVCIMHISHHSHVLTGMMEGSSGCQIQEGLLSMH